MPFSWTLPSTAPHDFFLSLDVASYFDYEHVPAEIPEKGMLRPVSLPEREVLLRIFFNGETEQPAFFIECDDRLDDDEIAAANKQLARILGTDLDLKPLYEQAGNDPGLAPIFKEAYGFKRVARANIFEDALNRIIIAQISHKPTARKMVYGVREAHGTRLESSFGRVSAWPRPHQLMKADPVALKKHGLSLRKGEYVVGLAHEIVSGALDPEALEALPPQQFYDAIIPVRGIGPVIAQDLMLFRNRPDAAFPSNRQKGEEKGLRKWVILACGGDPDNTSDAEFARLTSHWKGVEALALEHLYLRWVLHRKKQQFEKTSG
ncbi:MAG: DNA-3-methyladenine glycosylase family protein [Cyclonatronaceae bacterium]